MKHTWKQIRALLMAVVLMAGVLAGCGSKNESAGTPASTPAAETQATAQPEAQAPAETAASKQDVVAGIALKQSSLDAAESGTTQHFYLWKMMMDTLVRFNNETQELEPGLAESWSSEDGGKTYVFKLREGVKFHNGEELKASDVVFTFKRMDGTSFGNSVFIKLESIEAVDNYTVQMVLKQANMDWIYTMTLPYTSIMNEKAVQDNAETGTAVGTGPWQLDSYEFGNYTKLKAFDESWRGAPQARTFTFRTIPEASARLIALQNHEVDICDSPAAIEYGLIEDDKNLELIRYDGVALSYLAFNTQKAPGDNEDFRKAVAYALDVPSIIAVALEGNGTQATSVWGWNQYGYSDMGGFTQDLDKAREYLAKAYPDGGAKLELCVMGATHKTMAEVIQDELRQIGVEVTVSELDGAGMKQILADGTHQAITFSIGMNIYGDDTRRLLQPGISSNTAKYDSAYVMELMDKAVVETDEAARLEDYRLVQADLQEHVPYIPLYFPKSALATAKGVSGIDVSPAGQHDFSYVSVPAGK